ncbi:MAG TPA: hypothetical protein DCQ12_00240 [Candidatus Cloacimonas sp.]|nr:hypothetical protein [Candidatus Cloacimonas sp.]
MRRATHLCLVLLFILMSCGRQKEGAKSKAATKQKGPQTELCIWGPMRLRTLGLEQTVIKDFSKSHNCKIDLVLFENSAALWDSLFSEKLIQKPDVVMGLDNAYSLDERVRDMLAVQHSLNYSQFSREVYLDPEKRLVPYAQANLGVIYNSRVYKEGPSTFGELQDAAYFRQVGICDPFQTGEGRGSLYWTLALFGDPGYTILWQSIKKNIKTFYPDYETALKALIDGKINLLIGYNSTTAWLQETNKTDKNFKFNLFKEGSWQYSESAAICIDAANPALATKFISHLLDSKSQNLIPYKLGLFPTISKAQLPMSFVRIPLSSFTVNKRLKAETVTENLPLWHEFWMQTFDYSVIAR